MIKDFRQDLFNMIDKIKNFEHFAYSRFSDGELRILQNKRIILDFNRVCVGDIDNKINWKMPEYEHKNFDPDKHSWVREKLINALKYNAPGYYKGLSCKCCLDGLHGFTQQEEFDWQIKESGLNINDERLTWSNLFLNANYPIFLEHMLPYFYNYEIIFVCNENYNNKRMPLRIKKIFTVGNNCIVNDYNLIDKIKKYIKENNIENHLFLFSASTLSNFLCHELWMENNKNTYIDVGTSLNIYLGLELNRRYLRGFWYGHEDGIEDLKKVCIW